MNLEHYKAASVRTDADERALIPAFKRTVPKCAWIETPTACYLTGKAPWDETAERNEDLRQESRETDEREASGYWDNYEGDQ